LAEAVEITEFPKAKELYMLVGWRQWADAGSVSSGLPQYLVRRTKARAIGRIRPDGFYIFQIPGTHDLVRPVIKFVNGFPESLEVPENRLYYFENSQRGVVILLGDEPHLDVERYIGAVLDTAVQLGVKRIIGLGGVYGEIPFDKERSVSGSYSLPEMREEMDSLAVNLTDYAGGTSIGSYLCKRASDRGMEYVGFYAMVPIYDFSTVAGIERSVQIENDYMAWLGVMRRINYILKINIDLNSLMLKSKRLLLSLKKKVEELHALAPQAGVRDYFQRLSEEFEETPFIPLDDVWEEGLRRILDKLEDDEDEGKKDD
jgi:predicted ATP-grasp superfamily ATP-dependent carboligase